jgi:(1->4)-alpha-D-glucan 1-alpha-D-glucosylmutase
MFETGPETPLLPSPATEPASGPAPQQGPRIPCATYRVQLHGGFTFEAARGLVAYLDALGATDLYASPFLKARADSRHGYDIVDHNALNPEIGSMDDLRRLAAALRARGMGLILDFVPNHMGVGSRDNLWWMDVLENGPSSVYASFFDIDFRPIKRELENKVLLPVLGDHYGRVLEAGELRVAFDAGAFTLHYYDNVFPLGPRSYPLILEPLLPSLVEALGEEHEAVLELLSILTGLSHLPPRVETRRAKAIERRREKEILKRRLATLVDESREVRAALAARVERFNGTKGDPRSFDLLDSLLEEQAYRLSFWRVAAEEINYRRFFDVNELAAIRMENPAVFAAAHKLVFELVRDGVVTGLRIDHPDGLWDPVSYFERLQAEHRRTLEGPNAKPADVLPSQAAASLYVVVEKILARGEELPGDWAVHGTSGYEFAALLTGLFVDGSSERAMSEIYGKFIGERVDFDALIYQKKKLIVQTSLAGELNVLAHALARLSQRDRHLRDFTLGALRSALREVIACFPVYRTYIRESTTAVEPRDRAAIGLAVRLAQRKNPTTDKSVFDLLRAVFLQEVPGTVPDEDRALWREFVMRVQQLTAPVMAKGLEDTAFYVYNRLVSLNEVGGEPERFGVPVDEFHEENQARARSFPYSMLATSTHDTKRSEDVRARINVLSELTRDWELALERFTRSTRGHRTSVDEVPAPDPNEEYLFYQTVLGTWQPEFAAGKANAEYVERIVAYMRKATKEAKVNTSWINAHTGYDAAIEAYVRAVLAEGSAFLEAMRPLAARIAFFARFGSLSQALLKLASPGVPDLYQGNEVWDHSLVDPDNRRAVDWDRRKALLADVAGRRPSPAFARELVSSAEDGRIKMFVTHVALDARRRLRDAFDSGGAYVPLAASGARREHVVAFARRGLREDVAVIVPRLAAKLTGGSETPPVGQVWDDTQVALEAGRYLNAFTGETLISPGGSASMRDVLSDFPVALLERR